MTNTTLFALVIGSLIFTIALLLYVLAKRASQRNKIDANRRNRAVINELGDDVIWEAGGERPIIEVKGLQLKLTRRTALQKLAMSAVVTFAGWAAARGTNLLWAEEIAVSSEKGKPGTKTKQPGLRSSHSDQAAPHTDTHNDATVHTDNAHVDTHTDTHADTHTDNDGTHYDYDQHTDSNRRQNYHTIHTDTDHSDTPAVHTDTHNDTHNDSHNDSVHVDTAHTDTHNDSGTP